MIAECDRVDAALIELTRQDVPPLTVKQLEEEGGGAEPRTGWAVVSADVHKPLTERQARAIVAAMQSPRGSEPVRIAAE